MPPIDLSLADNITMTCPGTLAGARRGQANERTARSTWVCARWRANNAAVSPRATEAPDELYTEERSGGVWC